MYNSFGIDSRVHPTAILNHPNLIDIANHVSIDIGVYCSTRLKVGNFVHIAPYVCIIGGKTAYLEMQDFSGIAAGCKIICASDDFKNSLLNPQVPIKYRTIKNNPVIFERYSCAGTNSVVMQGVTLKEGSVLGANSLLLKDTEEWGIYAGNPAVKIGMRNKENVMKSVGYIETIDEYKTSRIIHGRFGKDEIPEKANLLCVSIGSVGNLAFVMNQLYLCGKNCKEIYIDFTKKELMSWENQNPYDTIMDQKTNEEYQTISCWGNELFDYDAIVLADIREKIQPYFKFNEDLMTNVNRFAEKYNIGKRTLGVHIRMSDMNSWHGDQFGYVYYKDYIKEIDKLKETGRIDNIFVASDNHETLRKLINRYGDFMIHNPNVRRTDNEQEKGTQDELRVKGHKRMEGYDNFSTPFLDMLLLTKCGHFIGRKYSNFSGAAIFLGNMKFKNIINL